MDYNDAFAIDSIHYNKRNKEFNPEDSEYQLNNYDYYKPKLVHDFYLKYFTSKLLFDTDILALKKFLEYHYNYCDNPEKYYLILDLKIIPKIEEIIEHAQINLHGRGYYDEEELKNGFVESEGVIYNWDLDYPRMFHLAGLNNLQNHFKKRIHTIKEFVKDYKGKNEVKPLKWIAGPSQLAIIIRELIDMGYMDAERNRGEINNAQLSRELYKVFSIDDCKGPRSIEIYLSPGNKRYKNTKENFTRKEFLIPHAKYTS